ncbi:hypothetical protein ANANG_G00188890 [Anguilla anguilla]|uniref:Uncharacterized protein n=1 Tax=Anguilla anguilla TaxID=7936 RepID=A0A9D3M2J3_ANGAN|nr:hypothetical protein ANANG_G00188890 [Anguilla anguilla]
METEAEARDSPPPPPQTKESLAEPVRNGADAEPLKRGPAEEPTAAGDAVNGPVSAGTLPNGDRMAVGPGAGVDGQANGPLPAPPRPPAHGAPRPVSPHQRAVSRCGLPSPAREVSGT